MDLTCIAMTQSFLIFGSKRGIINYFYLGEEDRALVNEYRHEEGEIRKLFPNQLGTRCLFVDSQLQVAPAAQPPLLPKCLRRRIQTEPALRGFCCVPSLARV